MLQRMKRAAKELLGANGKKGGTSQVAPVNPEPIYQNNQELGKEFIQHKTVEDLKPFTVSFQDIQTNPNQAISVLRENGLLIITNLLEDKEVDVLYENAKTAIEQSIRKPTDTNNDYEDEDVVVKFTKDRFKSYKDLANYHKSIFDIRSGNDNGMVDVFNFDISFNKEA